LKGSAGTHGRGFVKFIILGIEVCLVTTDKDAAIASQFCWFLYTGAPKAQSNFELKYMYDKMPQLKVVY
jgi:hypothetical protein